MKNKEGISLLQNKSLIICSIVRNAEVGLARNIPVINDLCTYFKDYKIVVYENDSKDNTKYILQKWQAQFPEKVHVSVNNLGAKSTIPQSKEVNVNPFFSSQRISRMVNLRNQYIEYIKKNNWSSDYVMVVDLDVAQLNLSGILSSFTSNIQWDAVTAFGYSISPKLKRRYHDTYALTMWGDENNPQTEAKIKEYADSLGKLKPTDDWVRVFSAFGGLAIYKYEAIKDIKYQLIYNNDSRVEVKCEHYSITEQMIAKGYRQFYINPGMQLKYQDLTFKIVLRSIKKILHIN